jgi:chloramphenicol-sensitive protein RarD
MNITSAHVAAITAFSLWGLLPLYWKIFSEVGSWDLFGHRLIWSFVTLTFILLYRGKISSLKTIWRQKRIRYMLLFSGLLISSNWLIYIYAVNNGRVLEASLGYFLNPLLNVFFGWVILKENIRYTQLPPIILAIIAIIVIGIQTDMANFPWIALVLAITFALYGLIRKVTLVGPMEGLTFETFFVIGPVLIYWYTQTTTPITAYQLLPSWKLLLLSLSGLVTCIPLVLFAYSARRLKLQTLGFIQYLSPSLKFVCGLVVMNEALSPEKLQTFFLIWIALAWYTAESFLFVKKSRKQILPIPE